MHKGKGFAQLPVNVNNGNVTPRNTAIRSVNYLSNKNLELLVCACNMRSSAYPLCSVVIPAIQLSLPLIVQARFVQRCYVTSVRKPHTSSYSFNKYQTGSSV
jgi:hypothetical protein